MAPLKTVVVRPKLGSEKHELAKGNWEDVKELVKL